jgi:hypothetical protein
VGTEQPSFQYFEPFDFSEPFNNRMPSVFRCVPHGGPAVFVLHELCGASPPTFDFAYRIANEGFSVFVPVLFGEANAAFRLDSAVRDAIHVCVSREFSILAANRSSPIVQWVRKLGSHVFRRNWGQRDWRYRVVFDRELRTGDDGRLARQSSSRQRTCTALRCDALPSCGAGLIAGRGCRYPAEDRGRPGSTRLSL